MGIQEDFDAVEASLTQLRRTVTTTVVDLEFKVAEAEADAAEAQKAYDDHMATHIPTVPPTTPNLPMVGPPSGYKKFYGIDFKGMVTGASLPANWTARTGKTNNGAIFRPDNLKIVNGQGLVHTAERLSTGVIYSGAANARVGIPQFRYLRLVARCTGFKKGSGLWPSGWERPQSGGSMQGEKDEVEGFAGHLQNPTKYPRIWGSGWIVTSSGDPYNVDQKVVDNDTLVPQSAWNDTHVYESLQTKGKVQFWIDGKDAGSISYNTAVWVKQFDDPTALFYYRTDLQVSGGSYVPGGAPNAGDTHGGPIDPPVVGELGKWTVESMEVWIL